MEKLFFAQMYFGILLGVFWIYPALCLSAIAYKTGTPDGWLAWLPVGNLYLLCRMTKTPSWWTFLCLVPGIGIVAALVLLWRLAGVLKIRGPARALIIVPLFNFPYLGYLALRREYIDPLPSADSNPSSRNASVWDVVLSALLPAWGLLGGSFAFFSKAQPRRGATMMLTGGCLFLVGLGTIQHSEHRQDQPREISEAIRSGDLQRIDALLKQNPALASGRGNDDETFLYTAAALGRTEVMKLLLANGAAVNAKRGYDGATPLFGAIGNGNSDPVALLLTNGAAVDVRTDFGTTPLHYAAQTGDRPAALLLLANHADVNARDHAGQTALHTALQFHQTELAALLRQHGGME